MSDPREVLCANRGCPNWPGEDEFCEAFEASQYDGGYILFVNADGMYELMCVWSGVKREEADTDATSAE